MSEDRVLTREDILKAQDIHQSRKKVDMNRWWGGYVYVQSMSGVQRGLHEADILSSVPGEDERARKARFRASLLVYCIVDEEGNPIFREQDVDALNEKHAAALDYLYDIAARECGYRQADIEYITKNSQSGQSADSTTA